MGDPDTDPHGAPIPGSDGTIRDRDLTALSDLPTGSVAVIREVSDDDSERLRFLGDNGFLLGTAVTVLSASADGGDVVVGGHDEQPVQPQTLTDQDQQCRDLAQHALQR